MVPYRIALVALCALLLLLAPVSALEIKNAEKMPHSLDPVLLDEIWREVVKTTNDAAFFVKIEGSPKPPRVIYAKGPCQEDGPGIAPCGDDITNAEIVYVSRKSGSVRIDIPREVYIYKRAFGYKDNPDFPYGAIAQEMFHEADFLQYGVYAVPELQHCGMISRGALEKVLNFIDARLGSGTKVRDAILEETRVQCRVDIRNYKQSH